MRRGPAASCARATRGHAIIPPTSAVKSLRLIATTQVKGPTAALEPANFRVEALPHAHLQNRTYPFVGPATGDLFQVTWSQLPPHVPGISEHSALPAAARRPA